MLCWFLLYNKINQLYVCVLCFSCVRLFATPWTVAPQAPLSMGILQARILDWVAMPSSREDSPPGLMPCPPSGLIANPGIKLGSPALQEDSLPAELPGKPKIALFLLVTSTFGLSDQN